MTNIIPSQCDKGELGISSMPGERESHQCQARMSVSATLLSVPASLCKRLMLFQRCGYFTIHRNYVHINPMFMKDLLFNAFLPPNPTPFSGPVCGREDPQNGRLISVHLGIWHDKKTNVFWLCSNMKQTLFQPSLFFCS